MVEHTPVPVKPAQTRPRGWRGFFRGDEVNDSRFSRVASRSAAQGIRPAAGESLRGRGRVGRCARVGVAYDGAQAALVGQFPLLSAAMAVPLVFWDAWQVCAIGVACAVAPCAQEPSYLSIACLNLRGRQRKAHRELTLPRRVEQALYAVIETAELLRSRGDWRSWTRYDTAMSMHQQSRRATYISGDIPSHSSRCCSSSPPPHSTQKTSFIGSSSASLK